MTPLSILTPPTATELEWMCRSIALDFASEQAEDFPTEYVEALTRLINERIEKALAQELPSLEDWTEARA